MEKKNCYSNLLDIANYSGLYIYRNQVNLLIEAHHDKPTKRPSEDSDQPGHPPRLIKHFA